jgi:hypothetical protein
MGTGKKSGVIEQRAPAPIATPIRPGMAPDRRGDGNFQLEADQDRAKFNEIAKKRLVL